MVIQVIHGADGADGIDVAEGRRPRRARVRSRFANGGRFYPLAEVLVPTGFQHPAAAPMRGSSAGHCMAGIVAGRAGSLSGSSSGRWPASSPDALACLLENDFQRSPGKEREGAYVEVKIGITDSPRELVFSSPQTPGEVEELVNTALGKDSNVLSLTDEKGRRFLVNAAKIAYVEIGVADSRRVGFGIGSSAARNG
jgi:Protein of unknown function (DUF3107)